VSAFALPVATLPLAWRRSVPLLPLVTLALALPVQALLDGFLVEQTVTPLAALVLALYSAGRHVAGAMGLAGAAIALAALIATRIAFDPAVDDPGDAVLTLVYGPLPLLVGRWMRGQTLLQRELGEKAEQLERERARNARHAAEEERMRIATDLQAAVTDGLTVIVREAQELPARLAADEHAAARALLAQIADRAREALADVRRVLGILRHDGPSPPLAPAAAGVHGRLSVRGDTGPRAGDAPTRRPRSLPLAGRDARRLDRALVSVLLVGAVTEIALTAPSADRVIGALTAVAIVTPLLWRRRRPVTTAAAVLGAIAIQSAILGLDPFPVSDIAALVSAAYAVGAHAERRLVVPGLLLLALGSALHAVVFHPDAVAPAVLGGVTAPWIVGRTVRGRRLLTRELREKAARMEHARELEAEAAMTAERVRVARELHDVVAHNISVIAIQAGGAEGIVARDPERAAQCAALIEAVGREAVVELGRLLGALSRDDAEATAPQPSLARVNALAQRARDAGLPVELRVEGEPAPLPAGVDLAAYRIVQEALANTSKHAGAARASVVVRYGDDRVEVEIADDGRGPNGARADTGSGHGLVGMRERVGLYGGTLNVGGRPSGGFVVRARLPVGRT
jgi:signal transduction histidine kinase